jgi:hypothetical protein
MNEFKIRNDFSLQAPSYGASKERRISEVASGQEAGWISQGESRSIRLRCEAGFMMCDF